MKVTKDLIAYLEHIDTLSKDLDEDQETALENILSVILTLLVAFKKGSNLGEINKGLKHWLYELDEQELVASRSKIVEAWKAAYDQGWDDKEKKHHPQCDCDACPGITPSQTQR